MKASRHLAAGNFTVASLEKRAVQRGPPILEVAFPFEFAL
jgi:hypothetical protein